MRCNSYFMDKHRREQANSVLWSPKGVQRTHEELHGEKDTKRCMERNEMHGERCMGSNEMHKSGARKWSKSGAQKAAVESEFTRSNVCKIYSKFFEVTRVVRRVAWHIRSRFEKLASFRGDVQKDSLRNIKNGRNHKCM